MFHVFRYIDNASCLHLAFLVRDANLRPPTHHVIDLILRVWRLGIRPARGEDVQSHAHTHPCVLCREVGDFEKFEVEFVRVFLSGD